MSIPFPSFSSETPCVLSPSLQAFLEVSKVDQADLLPSCNVFLADFELVLKLFQADFTADFLSLLSEMLHASLKRFLLVSRAVCAVELKAL